MEIIGQIQLQEKHSWQTYPIQKFQAQLAGAVEYTDCISAEGKYSSNEYPGYDMKQYDGEASVMLELWGMQSTPSLPSLPDPLWPGVVALDRFLSMS